jgi:CRISPR system Cascade subunit CasC
MFIDLHIIQNFAPANLNRDDTGAPKDAEFGGYRRARISSQCLKRAARSFMRDTGSVLSEDLGIRTKRLRETVLQQVRAAGTTGTNVEPVIDVALAAMGFPSGDEGKSEYLLFLGQREIARIAEVCIQHWKLLEKAAGQTGDAKTGKKGKKAAKDAVDRDVHDALVAVLDGGKARDLALFGRMVADLPGQRVDAACQVAHAISTHQVNMEFDYYTAVDDLKPDDTAGADMIGDVQFNSACFYRYANVDVAQLVTNLQGAKDAAVDTALAFVDASANAVPSGKQNSMAALNPPSLILAVVRQHGAWSLTNAFVEPVRPASEAGLVVGSIRRLDAYWQKLATMYGTSSVMKGWVCTTEPEALAALKEAPIVPVSSVPQLLDALRATLQGR